MTDEPRNPAIPPIPDIAKPGVAKPRQPDADDLRMRSERADRFRRFWLEEGLDEIVETTWLRPLQEKLLTAQGLDEVRRLQCAIITGRTMRRIMEACIEDGKIADDVLRKIESGHVEFH